MSALLDLRGGVSSAATPVWLDLCARIRRFFISISLETSRRRGLFFESEFQIFAIIFCRLARVYVSKKGEVVIMYDIIDCMRRSRLNTKPAYVPQENITTCSRGRHVYAQGTPSLFPVPLGTLYINTIFVPCASWYIIYQ